MIDVNDFIQYIVPMSFLFGVSVGGYVGVVIGLVMSGLRITRHKESE